MGAICAAEEIAYTNGIDTFDRLLVTEIVGVPRDEVLSVIVCDFTWFTDDGSILQRVAGDFLNARHAQRTETSDGGKTYFVQVF